jgi:hypothetical protein
VIRKLTRLLFLALGALLLSSPLGAATATPPPVTENEQPPAGAQAGVTQSNGVRSQLNQGTGRVLVVGDSLEVLTAPYLRQYLPGIPLTVNAKGGYNSDQIFGLFRQSYNPAQSVIVFDAGTNDNPAYPQILAANLVKVAGMIGNRCLVVPTIHGFTVNGVNNDGKNRAVRSFAAARPGTPVPDWAAVVARHPELMQSDDLHPNSDGAAVRARLIAAGVKSCLLSPLAPAAAPPGPARSSHDVRRPRSRAAGEDPAALGIRRMALFVKPEVIVMGGLLPQVVMLRSLLRATSSVGNTDGNRMPRR